MGANTASLNKRGKFDKSLIAVIMPLAWPTILEQALQTIVQFIDSAMVGRISANASAAVGLTQTVTWLLSGLFFAAGVGFLAVISRAIGADDRDYAQRTAGQAVVVAVIMGLVIGAAGMRPYISLLSMYRWFSVRQSYCLERCFVQPVICAIQCW